MKKGFVLFLYSWILVFFFSCGGSNSGSQKNVETTSSGHIKIAVDESLRPVIEQELKVFDSSFPNARIDVTYEPEADCFRDFFNDSARLILVTRGLTKEESDVIAKNGRKFKQLAVARGGIALIVNPKAQDTLMTVGQVKSILQNRFDRKYNIVFDNQKSGPVRYLIDSLIPGEKLPSNIYSLNSDSAVIKYVSENPNALGVLGIQSVYDRTVDTGAGAFIKGVTVVALKKDNDTGRMFYEPYQAFLALQNYPFTRDIYFISHDNWQGLGTGFANFLSSERGQLIFKTSWLVPLRVPLRVREVNITQ